MAGMKYILALDQGTTSSRAMVFDHSGSVVALAQKEFRQIFPKPGWVEHDATEIWATQRHTATEALGKAGRSEEHTSELQSRLHLVCRLLLEKQNKRQHA